jgi:Heterodisulfide reductase, subunit C
MDNLLVPGLLREIRDYGGLDANACLNCGSCTIVCDLSTDSAPFPRRQIQYALLGLSDSLHKSLEPWLCHDCRDCSDLCARHAEPGESMATLRRYLAARYDPTGLTSRIYRSTTWEVAALSITAIVVLALAYAYHRFVVGLAPSDLLSTPMGMEHMFGRITLFTRAVFLIPLVFIAIGAWRMYAFTMRDRRIPLKVYLAELKTFVIQMVSHRQMRVCTVEQRESRWLGHWLLGFAFAAMSVILFFFLPWFQTDSVYPIFHPQRWLGYAITAVMIFVPAQILVGRARRSKAFHQFSEHGDVTLPIVLLLTAISGIAVHIFRYMGLALTCHFAYAIHLAIAVPLLVIELPFGKLSHVIYRPLAIYFQAVSDRAALPRSEAPAQPVPQEARVA